MAYVTQTFKYLQEKAKQEGREEGREEGIQQKAYEAMLKVLTLRFGEPPSEVIERIHSVEDTEILDALHTQAVLAESLEAFRRATDELLK
jgi:predicted transposase YdaD